jgi:ATP-dependent Clp protease ATP-binding subunit ClpC
MRPYIAQIYSNYCWLRVFSPLARSPDLLRYRVMVRPEAPSTLSLERYAAEAKALIAGAQTLADERKHAEVEPLHLLARMLEHDARVRDAMGRAGTNVVELSQAVERALVTRPRADEPSVLSDAMLDLLERAERDARRERSPEVRVEDVLNALTQEIRGPAGELFGAFGIAPGTLRAHLSRRSSTVTLSGAAPARSSPGSLRELALGESSTEDPLFERTPELLHLLTVLERQDRCYPLLVGERGVGKRSLIRALVRRLSSRKVPPRLASLRLFEVDAGALAAGARLRGEVEERLKAVLGEVSASGGALVVDGIDQLFGQGPAGSAVGDVLRQALARGSLRLIGTTTPEGLKRVKERDPHAAHAFTVIPVEEPSVEDTVAIARTVAKRYERHHETTIDDAAIGAAVRLAKRYLAERALPESALDLLDEAAAQRSVTVSEAGTGGAAAGRSLSEEDVARTLAAWTGIPVTKMLQGEGTKLLELEARLAERVVGQDRALHAVARAVRRGRTGLRDTSRPIGSFLFLGPSGVGKTELAKALAEVVFDDEQALTRLDMSEFMERHMAQRLLGAPPGYADSEQGGVLTEAVRRRPYSVLLFDEVEKAHADVFNLLLQLLDDGRLTDGRGRLAHFSHTVVILTSNIGSERILDAGASAFTSDEGRLELEGTLLARLREFFRPELLNRLDEIIVFQPLGRTELRRIVDLELEKLGRLLSDRRVSLDVDDAARERLAELGHEPALGARPLRRAISREVQDPLASALLAGKYAEGSTVRVRVADGRITLD